MEAITMQFFIDLLNNIYKMILGILENAGVDVSNLPKFIIPDAE
jgi:hypothetical protein